MVGDTLTSTKAVFIGRSSFTTVLAMPHIMEEARFMSRSSASSRANAPAVTKTNLRAPRRSTRDTPGAFGEVCAGRAASDPVSSSTRKNLTRSIIALARLPMVSHDAAASSTSAAFCWVVESSPITA